MSLSPPMLGLIVAGRLVQTNWVQVDAEKFVVDVPEADNINHIVVFLTGSTPFPAGFGGQIYFAWPEATGQMTWHLLGHISNEKPSAIFKISNLKNHSQDGNNMGVNPMLFGQIAMPQNAQVGLAVESLQGISQSTPAASTTPSSLSSYVIFTQKMLDNFYNYVTSFGDSTHISINTVHSWYQNFQRRLQENPNFWK